MSDQPNWCPICLVHHPVDSMVRWCIQTKRPKTA